MEIDPMGSAESSNETPPNAPHARLNTWVALTVALLATFLGVCKVKDDNIVQAMQQAQADRLDHWNFYQARNIRQEVASATAPPSRRTTRWSPIRRRRKRSCSCRPSRTRKPTTP